MSRNPAHPSTKSLMSMAAGWKLRAVQMEGCGARLAGQFLRECAEELEAVLQEREPQRRSWFRHELSLPNAEGRHAATEYKILPSIGRPDPKLAVRAWKLLAKDLLPASIEPSADEAADVIPLRKPSSAPADRPRNEGYDDAANEIERLRALLKSAPVARCSGRRDHGGCTLRKCPDCDFCDQRDLLLPQAD